MSKFLFASAALSILLTAGAFAEERVAKNDKGQIVINYLPTDDKFRNAWPKEWEEQFIERCNKLMEASKVDSYGGTYFENEKSSYPNAFIDFLKGNREKALGFLQADDNEAWSDQTLKVDWFPSFTIKSQVRKYFFFGQYLNPDYKKKMFDSAKIWTEVDPLRRPNKFWDKAKGNEGWTPETKNSWVDVRNTDNLRAMRECAVYLMAEEVGSKEVQEVYRKKITQYVTALYTTGMGEWDSANYLAHTMTGYIQLYDFAKDPEMKLLGKAAMDYLCTAGAVKYYRGSYGGPNARDYNNIGPYAGPAGELAMYFGECPAPEKDPYRDFVHFFTSPYRPPEAVVQFARKNFKKPVEVLASKPSYEGWFKKEGGEDKPDYFETQYFANSYQLGTLPTGHRGDVNGFRLLTYSSRIGADTLILATSLKGYKGISTGTAGGDQLAHYRNQVIWMNAKTDIPFYLLLPADAKPEQDGDITFVKLEKTWLALHLINAKANGIDEAAAKEGLKKMEGYQLWSAKGNGSGPCGLVLEVGEQESHGGFDAFRKAVKDKSKVDTSKLAADKRVDFTGATGDQVGIALGTELPTVIRGGKTHDFKDHWACWAPAEGGTAPISLAWKGGTLHVEAGGKVFEGTVKDGKYSFVNK